MLEIIESPVESGSRSQSCAGWSRGSAPLRSSVSLCPLHPLWPPFRIRITASLPQLQASHPQSFCSGRERVGFWRLSWKQEQCSFQKLPEILILLCIEFTLSFKPCRGLQEGSQTKIKLKSFNITHSPWPLRWRKVLVQAWWPELDP